MLQKMRGTVILGSLVSGSSVDPHSDGGGLGSDDGFGCDAEAGGEGGDVCGGGAEDVVGEGGGFGAEGAGGRRALDSLLYHIIVLWCVRERHR